MLYYLARRSFVMILTLLVVSAMVFTIIQLPEGDFLSSVITEMESQGEAVDQKKIQFLREQYGLDKPLWEQYVGWLFGLVQGDLGFSFELELPVVDVLGDRIMLTIVVNFFSVLFIYIVAFPIGVYSATHQYSWGDYGLTLLGFLGLATPNFLLALILMYVANILFGTSIGTLMDPQYLNQPMSIAKMLSILEHLAAPVIIIGTAGTAGMIRRLRANLLDELHKQYVTTARAKGLGEGRLLVKYPLRMALNPFIADIGNLLPQVVSGSVIVSIVMGLETVGPPLVKALQSQDFFLSGAVLMFVALLTVIGMFLSDIALAMLDPRIRLAGSTAR